ncbi:Uma2 family endonuclease [Larkinella punicea]|uniref:Uma2 family endonuclease n=1 Tax=Larkinella punicea TaxID=2315727 RepID=A0A368JRC4_9BACT|nr:Uma2 family endonuclease [Larkinella punicea]RCR70022.1 Uma2 family endonuclease [Larkinella punicea]
MQAEKTHRSRRIPPKRYRKATPEEYLEFEYKAERKNEYVTGEIRPMSYTSENHGLLVANLIILLGTALKGSNCRVYPSDRMLHVPETGNFYYPDVMVVCGDSQFFQYKQRMQATLNPTVLIEVLSETTSDYDETIKWHSYKRIKTLQQYIRVHQNLMLLELYTRVGNSNDWLNTEAELPDQTVMIGGCEVKVSEVYEHVALVKK